MKTANNGSGLATVIKLGGGRWEALAPDGVNSLIATTKAEALAHVQRAEGAVAAMRCAGTVWPSRLDYRMLEAADRTRQLRADLERSLERQRRDAEADLERVRRGEVPFYSGGQSTRTAIDVDLAVAAWRSAWENFTQLAGIVRETAPDSFAGAALAASDLFRAMAGVR